MLRADRFSSPSPLRVGEGAGEWGAAGSAQKTGGAKPSLQWPHLVLKHHPHHQLPQPYLVPVAQHPHLVRV